MVDINELRNGNLLFMDVAHNDPEGGWTLKRVDKAAFEYIDKCPEDWHPVTLTKTWLRKAGFVLEKSDEVFSGLISFYKKSLPDEGLILFATIINENESASVAFGRVSNERQARFAHYLHELQNLYFDVTRQELQISR